MCHRGGPSSPGRGDEPKQPCVRLAYHNLDSSELNNEGLIDVGLYAGAGSDLKPKPQVSRDELAKSKYALVLDGATTANRLPDIMKAGQLVLLEDYSPMFSHFYGAMQPWKHYVPIGRDSYADIFGTVRFLIDNDELARSIAEAGQQFALRYLKRDSSECYTRHMLQTLGRLYRYKPRPLPPSAIMLRQAIELVEKDRVWMGQNPEDDPWPAEFSA